VVFSPRVVRSKEEVSGFADDSVKSHILRWTCYWKGDESFLGLLLLGGGLVFARAEETRICTSDGGCAWREDSVLGASARYKASDAWGNRWRLRDTLGGAGTTGSEV
jgi:hypothetical protein